MILKSRAFSLALLLAMAVLAPGVLKAQTQPMMETTLGGAGAGAKTGGTGVEGGAPGDPAPASTNGPEAATFDGANIWVATQFNDSVTRIRVSDGLVTGTFAVGKRPVALV